MSPFTGDSAILKEILKGEHNIWKDLSGPIDAIQILERKSDGPKQPMNNYLIQISTQKLESPNDGAAPGFNRWVGIYRVSAQWDLMQLRKVTVSKVSLNCE